MQINRQNLKWSVRMMSILLLVGLAEIFVVLFVPKPLVWVVFVAGLVPVLTSFLVILPLCRTDKPSPPSA